MSAAAEDAPPDGVPIHSAGLTGPQKAAVVLVSLGAEFAAEIFTHLREDEIEQLTLEVARMEAIAPAEQDRALAEFQELMLAPGEASTSGLDFAREILEKSLGADRAGAIVSRLARAMHERPFEFIRRTDPVRLIAFIRDEHPQTIALILGYLTPAKASAILGRLPFETQSDISHRIATMDRTAPEVVREVSRVLRRKLAALSADGYVASGGVEAIVQILSLVDRSTEQTIIEALEQDAPGLAAEIKQRLFLFEDLVRLDDAGIQAVLREVDRSRLARALKAADPAVHEKIFRNLSARAAALLRESIEGLGPIRLKQLEAAQQDLVALVRKLQEQGEVALAADIDPQQTIS
jgi:flagellar motor switch protein FliG